MDKKIFKISKLFLIAIVGLLVFTGCGKNEPKIETEKLEREESKYKISMEVPKEKGYQIVEKLEEKSEFALRFPRYILDGEKVQLYFENESFVYQTSQDLQKKYPEMDKENPNFDDYLKYGLLEKDELVDLNGRRAVKKELRYGPGGSSILKGYYYYIELKDTKGYIKMLILAKNDEDDIKTLMEDPEVKVIMDSIKVTQK